MSLTDGDKTEITCMINDAIDSLREELSADTNLHADNRGENAKSGDENAFDWEAAKENMIETECGIKLCRENYFKGKKTHFTFEEALEIDKEARKHGLRLPMVVDFEKLYAFYGLGENGEDTPKKLVDELGFQLAGAYSSGSLYLSGSYGYYWSSTVYNSNYAYNLYLDSSSVSPQDNSNRYYGYSVRCVSI